MLGRLKNLFSGEGLGARASRGTLITMLGILGANLLRLTSNLVLTRLLFPEAFGLMALVQVFLSGAKMFSDIGLHTSIVQHARGDEPAFIDTAWTLQVLRGFLLYFGVVLISPYVAAFYDEPLLGEILPVAGLGLVIAGFTPSKIMVASRHLQLGWQTALGLSNQAVTILVSVGLALWLQSVWAIVLGNLVGGVLRNLGLRIYMPGRSDRFGWEWSAARELVGFGKYIFVSTLASFVVVNGDRAVLGKFVSLEMLGVYSIAMSLAGLPMTYMDRLRGAVVFPLYSRRPPHEHPEARRKIFRARFMLTGLGFLGCLLLALFGDMLIRLMYDPRYYAAGGITVVAAVSLLPMIIVSTYGNILLANGRSDRFALLTVLNSALRLTVLYVGVTQYGVLGAAAAAAFATLLHYPILVALTWRYRAWDPVHDAVFAVIAIAIAFLAWSINADAILAVPRF
ncbi:oligosaccharide flippase family protein [Palleronia sp. KMU-117]|uniref:oligosaccharide flippase family protein n=1 Tax=Palleronia sp. KMU-117 TaxID=3434108 RepID=UPI003D72C388